MSVTEGGEGQQRKIVALTGGEVRHLKQPFHGVFAAGEASGVLDTLPYHKLGDKGFERLCHEILSAQGLTPYFFGDKGDKQYGVDIAVTRDGTLELYQCKNFESSDRELEANEINKWIKKFKDDWLGHDSLRELKPKRFIICCPYQVNDVKVAGG